MFTILALILLQAVHEPASVTTKVTYLTGQRIKTKYEADVYYGKALGTKRVPIINGYAPSYLKKGNEIIYDYRKKFPYSSVKKKTKKPPNKITKPPIEVKQDKVDTGLKKPGSIPAPKRIILPSYGVKP